MDIAIIAKKPSVDDLTGWVDDLDIAYEEAHISTDQKLELCKEQINELSPRGIISMVPQLLTVDLSQINAVKVCAKELYQEMGEDFITELLMDANIRKNISKLLNSWGMAGHKRYGKR